MVVLTHFREITVKYLVDQWNKNLHQLPPKVDRVGH